MTLDQLIQWDQHATLWLNNLGNTTWDPFWLMLSDTKFWYPAYLILTVFLFKELGWKKGLAVIFTLILGVVLTDQWRETKNPARWISAIRLLRQSSGIISENLPSSLSRRKAELMSEAELSEDV